MKVLTKLVSLLVLIALFTSTGCERKLNKREGVITIYCEERDELVRAVTEKYNIENNSIKVEPVYFNIVDWLKALDKMSVEIMAGDGPDIIYFNNSTFKNIYKIIESGAFTDLNTFINNDNEFDFKQYNETVLDCGIIEEKRYFIPLNYEIPSLMTTKQLLNEYSFDINENNLTLNELVDICNKHITKNNQKSFLFSRSFSFYKFALNNGYNFVDINNKSINIDINEFSDVLNKYKEISKYFCKPEIYESYKEGELGMFQSGILLFSNSNYIISPRSLFELYYGAPNIISDDIAVFSFPNNENKSVAYLSKGVAINSNSRHKEEAYRYIKQMMSEEVQNKEYTTSLPVNNAAAEFIIDKPRKWRGVENTLPDEMRSFIKNSIVNIEKCEYINSDIDDIFSICIEPFLEDSQTIEQVTENLERKMETYLNE